MDSLTSNRPDTREALQKRYGAEAIPAEIGRAHV